MPLLANADCVRCVRQPVLARKLCETTSILTYLINRISVKKFEDNKLAARCEDAARFLQPTPVVITVHYATCNLAFAVSSSPS